MDDTPKGVVSVGGIRADIGSDGRLVFLSETGVSDTLWYRSDDSDESLSIGEGTK